MKHLLTKCMICAALFSVASCGTGSGSDSRDSATAETGDFVISQPLENGEYLADSYDITGKNERSGKFDGRILVSLSPEQSALYVYENGNRAKIDYKILLSKPFEKGDSGIYVSSDTKGKTVTISTDSTSYTLSFDKNESNIKIGFDKTPKTTGTAVEMLERITKKLD